MDERSKSDKVKFSYATSKDQAERKALRDMIPVNISKEDFEREFLCKYESPRSGMSAGENKISQALEGFKSRSVKKMEAQMEDKLSKYLNIGKIEINEPLVTFSEREKELQRKEIEKYIEGLKSSLTKEKLKEAPSKLAEGFETEIQKPKQPLDVFYFHPGIITSESHGFVVLVGEFRDFIISEISIASDKKALVERICLFARTGECLFEQMDKNDDGILKLNFSPLSLGGKCEEFGAVCSRVKVNSEVLIRSMIKKEGIEL